MITKNKNSKQISIISGVFGVANFFIYTNNFITITKAAQDICQIENYCFNALKNSGYELTHNYSYFNFVILTKSYAMTSVCYSK